MMRILTYTWSPLMLLELWWCLASRSIHPLRVLVWASLACCLIVAKIQFAILREPSKPLASESRALFLSHPSIRAVITSWCLLPTCSPVHRNDHLARTTCFSNTSVVVGPSIQTVIAHWSCLRLYPSCLDDLPVGVVERVRRGDEDATIAKHAANKHGDETKERARDEKMKCDHIKRELANEWLRVCALFVPYNVCDW